MQVKTAQQLQKFRVFNSGFYMALSRSSFSFKQWLSFEIHTHIRAFILQLWINVCILSNDIGSDVLQGDSWTEIFATRNHHERWTYVLLLKSKLEFQMRVHNCDIFMHNGASDHQSKVVKKFLKQNHIQNLSWPGNSLDLNPIENLWNLMKKKLSAKIPQALMHFKQQLKMFGLETSLQIIAANW